MTRMKTVYVSLDGGVTCGTRTRDDLFLGGGVIPNPSPFSGVYLRGRDRSFLTNACPGVMKRSLSRTYPRPEVTLLSSLMLIMVPRTSPSMLL